MMNLQTYNSYDSERLNNFENEADEIIDKLKEDEIFCHRFFYGTNPKGCNIARLRSKIISDIKEVYGIVVDAKTISETLYLTLWADGTWDALDTYSKKSTFFAWLRKVAKNAVMERLEDEHWITGNNARTVGNTRLKLLSKPKLMCKTIIDELMVGSKYHSLLTAIYVDRLTKEEIMKSQNMDEAKFEAAKKKAENKLKAALLQSPVEFYEEEVLRDKKGHVVTLSSEFAADMSEWCREKTGVNPFADVFGIGLSDEEIREKTVEFLYDFTAKLDWTDRDRYIWQRRFIINADPESLAWEFGRTRGWLDTRYSRLNEKFEIAIRKWWKSRVS